jgi:nitrite reductase/ring-hydroxylating ferredoxin subunit
MYEHGWFQVAFERDLEGPLTAASVEHRRLLLVKSEAGVQAFDADCPHRGAHLALGGRLEGGHVVCPFHGYRVGLGDTAPGDFAVRKYPTLSFAGMVFVRLSEAEENGLTTLLPAFAQDHVMIPGFEMAIGAPAQLVIENGFDRRHFNAVHRIGTGGFVVDDAECGPLVVDGSFLIRPGGRFRAEPGETMATIGYRAVAISPGLIVVSLSGSNSYTVITAATPVGPASCLLRLTLALPVELYGPAPTDEGDRLLQYSRMGIEQDRVMWENLSATSTPHFMPDDLAVERFHLFCERFCQQTPCR